MADVKEQIKKDYLSGIPPKKLAEKYDTSLNTIKSWIKRYGWSEIKKRGALSNTQGAPSVASRMPKVAEHRNKTRTLRSTDSFRSIFRKKHCQSFRRCRRIRWMFCGIRYRLLTLPLSGHRRSCMSVIGMTKLRK